MLRTLQAEPHVDLLAAQGHGLLLAAVLRLTERLKQQP